MTKPAPVDDPVALFDDIVSMPEMPVLFEVKRGTVEQWRLRRRGAVDKDLAFPEEDDHLGSVPAWQLKRLEQWAALTGRPIHVDRWREKRESGGFRRPSGVPA